MTIKLIVEALLLASPDPLSKERILSVFAEDEQPTSKQLEQIIQELCEDYSARSIELQHVASGYRFQTRADYAPWVARLSSEKPTKYSPAFLETLAIIAYRQPVTRGDIEQIRGVSVSSAIFKALLERDWIRVIGQRDTPGRPALYATTKAFLDYFNLTNLSDLPEMLSQGA